MEIKKYSIILSEKLDASEALTYSDLLRTEEWREKREEILHRDNFNCTECAKPGSIIKDKKAYRKKTPEEIKTDEIEIERIYEQGIETFTNLMDSLGIPKPYKLPDKPTIDQLVFDLNPTFLHVHHKYYIRNRNPWEYQSEVLITVCHECHKKIHQTTKILIYSSDDLMEKAISTNCSKCEGIGYITQFHYYLDGICFKCNGRGY